MGGIGIIQATAYKLWGGVCQYLCFILNPIFNLVPRPLSCFTPLLWNLCPGNTKEVIVRSQSERKERRKTEGTPRKCPFLLVACWCSYNRCSCWLRHCCLVGVLNSTGNSHGFPAVAPWDAKSAKVMLSIMRTISQSLWKAMLLSLLQKMQQVCMEAVVIECCPDAMTVS